MAAAVALKRAAPEATGEDAKKPKPADRGCSVRIEYVCIGDDDLLECVNCGKQICSECSTETPGWSAYHCDTCEDYSCCTKVAYCKRCNKDHCPRCAVKCASNDECDLGVTLDCEGGPSEYRCDACGMNACYTCYEADNWGENDCDVCRKIYCCLEGEVETCGRCERQRCRQCARKCCDTGQRDTASAPADKEEEK